MTTPQDRQTGEQDTDGQETGGQSAAGAGTERLEKAVRAAENALIEFEIAVETFRVEVENFSRLHEERLGPLYARLEELDARIAEAQADRTGDPEDRRRAKEARALVSPMPSVSALFEGWLDSDGMSQEAAAMLSERSVQSPPRVRPGEDARKLFRELARKAHPDLARTDAERDRRGAFIARVNLAYSRGDAEELRELLAEWEAGPAPEQPRPARGEELFARLEWLARRKELLTEAAGALEDSAIAAMLRMAPDDPDGLLEEVAAGLRTQIDERERQLAELLAG
ncbi:hypothetical protein GCM10009716_33690 [Streptomyces sodiiphilus]|uniref:J domain-containing protein n=1 Tax=Streptomyces sodiiphilus TaxID=226217 RepID=A0ABN2PJW3_9ACTN